MSNLQLNSEFHSPEELRKKVADFVKFLKSKKLREREFGALKGKIKIFKVFDAPLNDFKEYIENKLFVLRAWYALVFYTEAI